MSQSNSFWKWMFVGLIVTVTFLVAGYSVMKEFKDQQEGFNQALAADALKTNVAIVELRTQDQALEDGLNTLDEQQSADIARLEQALRDQQNVIDSQQRIIDNMQNQIYNLQDEDRNIWTRIYELETRVGELECEIWGEDNECSAPENPCGPSSCSSGCSSGYYDRFGYWVSTCNSCYSCP